ncbi:MAG: fatty acid--CoA ligase [Deltaproteobacteria bacterium]|nr:fatty acid--CoA ligase [Deltaproteobacteria bacterium]
MSDLTIARTPSAYDYPLLIKHLWHAPLVNTPDQEIVYRDVRRMTYRELRERVGRLASALAGLGVRPGDTVAVMDWDSHRYLECFYAVPMMGAVLHTVNVRLSPEQILYTINHAQDDVILVHADFVPVIEAVRDRIERPVKLVLLTDDGSRPESPVEFAAEYEEMVAGADPGYEFPDLDENTRATTFYTTGTTGLPKGVYFSHRQLVLHTLAVTAALASPAVQGRFHRDDVYMPITPMFHVHAWGIPYVALLLGVKQVYPGRYAPDVLLGLIQTEGVTFSHCVPTILHMLLSSPAAQNVDLSGWKVIIGGSALPQGLCQAALARGIDIYTGYGMSETCPVLTLAQLDREALELPPEEQAVLRCKTGRPIPLVDLKIVDEEMNELPRDGASAGEIVVRAPWLTQGYLKDPANSENLWRGGYLHTGDVAVQAPDGYVKITDRIKDVIKSGGEWISSLDIEDLISKVEGVSECAVIGVPDPKWGERPLALVVPKPGYEDRIGAAEIQEFLKGYAEKGVISRYAVPERVVFVDAIAKTSVGKIDKKTLRAQYGKG